MPKTLTPAKVTAKPARCRAVTGGDARTVGSGPVTLYRHIGRRIRQDILREKRAEYGAEIVAALRRQLGWTHFRMIIPPEDD